MKLADSSIEPRVLIVGAGETGRELVRRLSKVWRVSIVDADPERLARLDGPGDADRVRKTRGDGTSRLVLDAAGIASVEYVIATAGDDAVNLEVCRLARQDYGKANVFAETGDAGARERYREAGVECIVPADAAAAEFENRLFRGVGASLGKAASRGEVVEAPVLPSSPMIGRPLSSVRSRRWRVGAIYRGEALVVPTGAARIQADDRVVLIGEKEILPSIAEFFRIGEPEFPLNFGSNVLVLTEGAADFEGIADELRYLLDHSRARGVEILFWPHEPGIQRALDDACRAHGVEASTLAVFGSYGEVAGKHVMKKDCGLFVVPDRPFRFLESIGLRRTALSAAFRKLETPFAILRGSQPYGKILLPVTHDNVSMEAARLAFDLARIHKSGVTVVNVTPPRFVAGETAIEAQKAVFDQITHLAHLHRVEVARVQREGNPIDEILKLAGSYDLLLLSHSRDREPSFFNPDVSQHLLRRSPVTTIALPA